MIKTQYTNKYIKIYFNCKAFHPTIYAPFFNKILKKAKIMGIVVKGPIFLPTKTSRFTVLRSPHVNKTAREQFELVVHKRLFVINFKLNSNIEKKKAMTFINFVKKSCVGIQLKVTYKHFHKNNQLLTK